MKKILLFLVAVLPLPFLVACPGKSDNNNNTAVGGISGGVVVTAAGAYTMAGTITNINASCGSGGVATLTVSQSSGYNGSYGGQQICTASVGIGGAFNCPVPYQGTYLIRAQAGNCVVQGNMAALTNGQQALQICLGSGCSCYSSQNCVVNKTSNDTSAISAHFPGTGDLKVDSASLFLSSAKASAFDLSVEASNGNDLLNTTGSWKGSVAADGTLTLGSDSAQNLSYSAQVDASLLQNENGFCDSAAAAAAKAATYAQQSGLSNKAILAVRNSFSSVSERVCVYPQGEAEISRAVSLKSSAKINSNRLWFIVVEESQLAANTKLFSRPKTEAKVAVKKAPADRKIASDSDILVEEVALGFLIKK